MSHLETDDKQVYDLVCAERKRQQGMLDLIASENHTSRAVMEATGSVFTDKYAEGYPQKRYYGGCEVVDDIEQLCIDRAKALFGAEHANVQPHCGTSANMAVYYACLQPGDKILGMSLACGGHLSHGLSVNFSGRYYTIASYGVDEKTEMIDMDAVRRQALAEKPKLIMVGASAYPRTLDFAGFAAIARECGALLVADIAHIAGLVATALHPSPVPHADFVTTTTHKTLRGPRSGLILCKAKWAREIDKAVFPGLQGGPLEHVIAAKAVAFGACAKPEFKTYCRQVIANAKALADALASKGWRIVSGGTDNHLMLVDLRSRDEDLTGQDAQQWLEAAGIVCNKNKIPFDPRSAAQTSGMRLGTPALTTRGMTEPQMQQLAGWIDTILAARGDAAVIARIRGQVSELCEAFPIPAVR
ncbi:MAG: serine hydroxymethyltransferase [Planctomycetes bacterium]|nr:serine hydroxymethyltransferase [Planctomycetota bacterium]